MKLKRTVSVIAAFGLAGALLTGCGSGNGPGADGYDLTVWVYSDMVQNEQGKLMNEFVDEFKAEHKNVNSIKLVPKNDADLLSSLMAGVGLPDAFSASARDAKNYKSAIDLLDLKSAFADSDYSEGYYPNALNAVSVDDGVWAIPFISYIPIIFRNLTVLKEAGVNPDDGIPTYDAFLEQLAQVKKSGVDATNSWSNSGYYPAGAVLASDAPNLTVGVKDGKTTVEASQLTRTFQTLSDIEKYANSNMTYDADTTVEAFKSNKLGYLIGGPWMEPGIKQSGVDYDFVLVPPYEVGGWTGGLQGWDFFYGVNSDDKVRNGLVEAWLKKLGSFDSEKRWTMEVGRPTLRQDVMDDPEVLNAGGMAKISSQGLKNGMMQMDFMHSSVFWPSAISDPAAKLATGSITPSEAAQQFVDGINALYAEAGE